MTCTGRQPNLVPRTIGVQVCSYRRPQFLLRLLAALNRQDRRPDDVVVVIRQDDVLTSEALASSLVDGLPLRIITVSQPGTVAALNAGLRACRTDVLAITDDDTVPHADWLHRILVHFTMDSQLGGLGGRDWCHDGVAFDTAGTLVVGRLQWFGRMIGGHHRGVGAPRSVDFLKGANMSYRRAAIEGLCFDRRLRGAGAQPLEDSSFAMTVRMNGWKLLYDPAVAVDHFSAHHSTPRAYAWSAETKAMPDESGLFDFAHNEVVAVWRALSPGGRLAFVAWSLLVGTSIAPGLLQAVRYMPRLGSRTWRRLWTTQAGRLAGFASVFRHPLASGVQADWRAEREMLQ
ncbi:glycosyltransferase [Paracraurococcus lichenis]|uniref:Glycosyltransferase n=1 Tax=Paracraurococcus lichenis TaxID=3064888 RepID=A0ABT9EAY1_9PROT|nr:glycosyltransferase [Paracraurococcus sp. LOR1-02]MDO9713365.1 glycosyltransferase [Paracraurococcus sp. LOR1-02]